MFASCLFRRSGPYARFAVLCTVVVTLMVSSASRAQDPGNPPKRILLLYPFDNEEQIYSGFDHALRSQLRSGTGSRVEFYTEYLDLVRFPAPTHAASLVRLLKLKYAEQTPDLIVPVSYSALQFMLKEGKHLFPGTPLAALFNIRRMDELKRSITAGAIGRGITGFAFPGHP